MGSHSKGYHPSLNPAIGAISGDHPSTRGEYELSLGNENPDQMVGGICGELCKGYCKHTRECLEYCTLA